MFLPSIRFVFVTPRFATDFCLKKRSSPKLVDFRLVNVVVPAMSMAFANDTSLAISVLTPILHLIPISTSGISFTLSGTKERVGTLCVNWTVPAPFDTTHNKCQVALYLVSS